ncbi:MAG: magnesium-translocating P-type ATPase [Acidobacteria bacterium]|nr:magnesium-translocating P-type ATPase [Acidobacteriota bacterium]
MAEGAGAAHPSPPGRPAGLTSAEAARRLARDGPNEPVPIRPLSALVQVIDLFANPLVAILLVASGISASLGQRTDALIIAAIVLLGIAINFWQTYRSQQAADRLRASVAATATVERDGRWQEIPLRDVVSGDLVRLSAGDLVPADARLIEARDLSVQQAMLTGESLPVDKYAAAADAAAAGPDDPGFVFMATSVVSGTAVAATLATGPRTVFGDIARRLGARAPASEFELGLRRFSLLILRTTVALVLFILLVALAMGRDPIESLLFAVALGVGLTPEFLPMIASVTLTAGAMRMARERVIVRHLPAIQNLGSIDILCSDKTGTLTKGDVQIDCVVDGAGQPSDRPLRLAALNSRFSSGIRSPLDAAILEARPDDAGGYRKVDEIPFDFERRRVSVVVDAPDGRRLLVTKGAPEQLLPLTTFGDRDGETESRPGSSTCERLGTDGLRVLAVAYREVAPAPAYTREDERDLRLAGFIAFADPVRPDAGDAIAELGRDGVAVKILTGDNQRVAARVCEQVGIEHETLVTGEELARLDDAALGHVVEEASVFARVSPSQKNRIIEALKRRGHVVGFLGDGINDVPSLHTADVGISVLNATDAARESADIILGDTGLRVLHRGILEGRRASGNMMKYLLMGTSSNFGNMFSMAAASVFLPFLPMLPTQILLNNLLYDVAQITIPADRVDRAYVRRPQRWDMRLIRDFMLMIGPVSSLFDFLTFYVLLHVLHATETLFHTGWFVESLATQTLVLFVIRTMENPLRSRPSAALAATTLAVVALGLALPATPLAPLLGFTIPPLRYFAFLVAATSSYLVLVEIVKRALVRSHRLPIESPPAR